MTNTWPNISRTINPLAQSALIALNRIASGQGIPFFIIGATARDIHLEYLHDINPHRRTMDTDIAVMVDSWKRYGQLEEALMATGRFVRESKIQHRFRYKGDFVLDILPFGGLEESPGHIFWPPDSDPRMSVVGFQEAFDHAILVTISDDTRIKVVSLPGLVMLKLLAWRDRKDTRPQSDIHDITLIVRWYGQINQNRLFDDFAAIFEDSSFDLEMAGSWLLGLDMAQIMTEKTKNQIIAIIQSPSGYSHDHSNIKDMRDADKNGHRLRNEKFIQAVQNHLPGKSYDVAEEFTRNLLNGILGHGIT